MVGLTVTVIPLERLWFCKSMFFHPGAFCLPRHSSGYTQLDLNVLVHCCNVSHQISPICFCETIILLQHNHSVTLEIQDFSLLFYLVKKAYFRQYGVTLTFSGFPLIWLQQLWQLIDQPGAAVELEQFQSVLGWRCCTLTVISIIGQTECKK